mgnify:CR=1 FL=1
MNALKSKTLMFNALIAVLGVLELHQAFVQQVVGPQRFGLVMLGIAVVGTVLRVVTTQPLSEK